MALTAAEKMKRRRQKLKDEGKYEEYKEKHKEEVKKSREKKKLELSKFSLKKRESMKLEERVKTRERVAKCRALKKTLLNQNPSPLYKTASSLGKATKRAVRSLPKSPRKRSLVVRKLFDKYNNEMNSPQSLHSGKISSAALSSETAELVKKFYLRDDISRQAPGLKDVTTLNENGVKVKMQTRHLYSTIRETHAMFQAEFEDVKIGKSKFSELRPAFVKVSSKIPHNVCLCRYHENFIQAIKALHGIYSNFPKYTETFWDSFLCNPNTKFCWLGKCNHCSDKLTTELNTMLNENGPVPAKWFVWTEIEGVLQKVLREDTLEELIKYTLSIESNFKSHVYTKREQAKSYQIDRATTLECREDSDRKIALLQVDFSENYTCIAQDEVQSFHWQQPQVSLFTCSLCYNGKQYPIVVVSDNTDHTKNTIVAYVSRVLEELPSGMTEVRIWSDGPSSQFKNKFIAASLRYLENKHDLKIQWNYFATSHGKGPVDGIGGSVKRQVRQAVLSRKDTVFNAADFCRVATQESGVSIIHLTSEDIDFINKDLDTKSIFDECELVKGISKVHALCIKKNLIKSFSLSNRVPVSKKTDPPQTSASSSGRNTTRKPLDILMDIYCIGTSPDDSSDPDEPDENPATHDHVKAGCFVLVKFHEEKNKSVEFKYAAVCQSDVCQSDMDADPEVKIMCLKSVSGQNNKLFKLDENDITFVNVKQVLNVLPHPEIEMKGGRMYYRFKKPVDVKEK